METAFPNITIKFIVSFLFLSTYVLGIVLNALHTLLSSIRIIFKDSLFYRWRLDDLKARTFKSCNFAHFQGSSQIIHAIIWMDYSNMILLFSNWANRHVIRIKKKKRYWSSKFWKMFIVFFSKPHFNIESSNLKKSHKPNEAELGKNTVMEACH